MISSRYALPVLLLLVAAFIPTLIHSYLGAENHDGREAQAIDTTLAGFSSHPSKRNARWGQDVFDSQDWFERIYAKPGTPDVRLFVARSYDHKRLYHHPELGLSYGTALNQDGTLRLAGEHKIPVFLLRGDRSSSLVAYALLYDDQFVENPILHQIRDSLSLLVRSKKPMTLFYVSSSHGRGAKNKADTPTIQVLQAAVESFLAQPASVTNR